MTDERRDAAAADAPTDGADAVGNRDDAAAEADGGARSDGGDADAGTGDDAGARGALRGDDSARSDGGAGVRPDGGSEVEATGARPTVPSRRYSSFERGSLSWLLQRVTAAFLVVVLAFHFFLLHFVNHAFEVTFAGTNLRMQQLGYSVTMVLFLVTATFHGVNGVYNALVNQGLDGRQKTAVKWVLVVAGVALVVQGLRVAVAMAAG